MYTTAVNYDADVDSETLPAHLADCLRRVDGRAVKVDQDRVPFTGGVFRLVSNWNVLVPFESGDLTVDSNARQIRCRLSFRQLVMCVTAMAGAMTVFVWFESRSWQGLMLIPFMWIWLVGGNLVIGIPRFKNFVRRSIETAPR